MTSGKMYQCRFNQSRCYFIYGSNTWENYCGDIFQKFGSRLLEQNVRSFLSIRGHVNKNMLGTIENNSKMFFAYNNGLTMDGQTMSL